MGDRLEPEIAALRTRLALVTWMLCGHMVTTTVWICVLVLRA